MNKIILELLSTGKEATVSTRNGKLVYTVRGFFKSDTVELVENETGEYGSLTCRARYQEEDRIEEYRDLVMVAYSWYKRANDRVPTEAGDWKQDFEKFDLI